MEMEIHPSIPKKKKKKRKEGTIKSLLEEQEHTDGRGSGKIFNKRGEMKKTPNGRKEIRGISNVEEDTTNEEERGLVRGVWGEGYLFSFPNQYADVGLRGGDVAVSLRGNKC